MPFGSPEVPRIAIATAGSRIESSLGPVASGTENQVLQTSVEMSPFRCHAGHAPILRTSPWRSCIFLTYLCRWPVVENNAGPSMETLANHGPG